MLYFVKISKKKENEKFDSDTRKEEKMRKKFIVLLLCVMLLFNHYKGSNKINNYYANIPICGNGYVQESSES